MRQFARLAAATLLIASGASPVCAQMSGPTVSPLLIPAAMPALVSETLPRPLPNPVRAMIEAARDDGKKSEVETVVSLAQATNPRSIWASDASLAAFQAYRSRGLQADPATGRHRQAATQARENTR